MTRNMEPTEFKMAVVSITATCNVDDAKITRKMNLIDLEAFEKDRSYSSKYHLTMPAIEGVGTGDVLWVRVGWEHDAEALEAKLASMEDDE
jgi:hypothetical protein